MTVYATLKSLDFEFGAPLPSDAENFGIHVRMIVGPPDSPGEESFDLTLCTPEWLAARCREVGVIDARHHMVVNFEDFDQQVVRDFLERRIRAVSGETWREVGEKLGRLGFWEFEDYRP